MKKKKLIIRMKNENKSFKPEPELKNKMSACCVSTLDFLRIDGIYEVSVTFTGEKKIQNLNRDYRYKDSVTDVLSFPLGENGIYDINPENGRMMLVDIVICCERAKHQAMEYCHSEMREFCYLTVHSLLHLLGYDHMNDVSKNEMRAIEEGIMALQMIGY